MSQKPKRELPWAAIFLLVLLSAGQSLLVAGVYVLAGLGWSLIAGAVTCLVPAGILARGMRS